MPEPDAPYVCGHPGPNGDRCGPCAEPPGHDLHRDADGCSWPAPRPAVPMTRTAVRAVIRLATVVCDPVDWERIEKLTDEVWAKLGGAQGDAAGDFVTAMRDRDPADLETLRAEAWRTGDEA